MRRARGTALLLAVSTLALAGCGVSHHTGRRASPYIADSLRGGPAFSSVADSLISGFQGSVFTPYTSGFLFMPGELTLANRFLASSACELEAAEVAAREQGLASEVPALKRLGRSLASLRRQLRHHDTGAIASVEDSVRSLASRVLSHDHDSPADLCGSTRSDGGRYDIQASSTDMGYQLMIDATAGDFTSDVYGPYRAGRLNHQHPLALLQAETTVECVLPGAIRAAISQARKSSDFRAAARPLDSLSGELKTLAVDLPRGETGGIEVIAGSLRGLHDQADNTLVEAGDAEASFGGFIYNSQDNGCSRA